MMMIGRGGPGASQSKLVMRSWWSPFVCGCHVQYVLLHGIYVVRNLRIFYTWIIYPARSLSTHVQTITTSQG